MSIIANLVRETSTTIGTGNVTVAAATGWRRASDAFGTGVGNPFQYVIRHTGASEYEIGYGYMSDANTLVRSLVVESSNSNALVDFSAGDKDVVCSPTIQMVGESIDRPQPDDLEFEGFGRHGASTVPTGFTYGNQGGSTYLEKYGAGTLTDVGAGGGHNWRYIVRSVPGSVAQIESFADLASPVGGTWFSAGLLMRESSTGKLLSFGLAYNNQIQIGEWSSNTGFNAWPLLASLATRRDLRFWRIIFNSASDWDFQASPNGKAWTEVKTAYNPSYFAGSGLDQYGFGQNMAAFTSGGISGLACEHLRAR